jgi:hypothetical protein
MEREYASADEVGALLRDLFSVVPGLEDLSVEVVRLSPPDRSGCNWMAKHSPVPVGAPEESRRLLKDILRNARRGYNLWDVH